MNFKQKTHNDHLFVLLHLWFLINSVGFLHLDISLFGNFVNILKTVSVHFEKNGQKIFALCTNYFRVNFSN